MANPLAGCLYKPGKKTANPRSSLPVGGLSGCDGGNTVWIGGIRSVVRSEAGVNSPRMIRNVFNARTGRSRQGLASALHSPGFGAVQPAPVFQPAPKHPLPRWRRGL